MSEVSESTFFELAAVTRAVGVSARFSKVLSDPSLPVAVKVQLLNDVTKGVVGEGSAAVAVLSEAFTSQRPGDSLAKHLLGITADTAFDVATSNGQLIAIEQSLFGFADLLRSAGELRMAFTNPGTSDAQKHVLVDELLSGKSNRLAVTLTHVLIDLHHGRELEGDLRFLGERAAARAGHVVADVRSAVALDDVYKQKVASVLSAAVGDTVQPRFSVDSSIVGSLVVRIGDEVWDGSVRRRLEQAREALVGA